MYVLSTLDELPKSDHKDNLPFSSESFLLDFGKGSYDFGVGIPSLSAILISTAREEAPIFSIT